MVIDILSERGFYVVADVKKTKVPIRFEKKSDSVFEAVFSEERVVIFRIYHKRPIIRTDESSRM